jgi:hypothetical protein
MRRAFPALALCLLLLAGCSGKKDDTTPEPDAAPAPTTSTGGADALLTTAMDALRGVKSVHVVGRVTTGNEKASIDMRFVGTTGAIGKVTRPQFTVSLVRIRDKTWLKGRRFWESSGGKQLAAQIGDRYVLLPPGKSDILTSLEPVTRLDTFTAQTLPLSAGSRFGPPATIRGIKTQTVESADGTTSIYVRATAPAYPIRLAGGASSTRVIDFSEYNKPVKLEPPAGALDGSSQ